jgi:hypothetical protein
VLQLFRDFCRNQDARRLRRPMHRSQLSILQLG